MMNAIGAKFILSGRNYEEEFKIRVGEQQATAQVPKVSESQLEMVMSSCGVRLTQDERLTLQSFVSQIKDPQGQLPLLEFL